MAVTYTYDDFLAKANALGLYSQFSSYDLDLARQNPTAGMGILQAKINYAAAKTDAEKAAANALANQYRSQSGNYTGGSTGSEYIPGYTTGYEDEQQDLLDQSMNYGDFEWDREAPEYTSRWDDQLQAEHDAIQNYGPFNQDVTESSLWQNYKKQAIREADRSYQDSLGTASAMTGGQLSTSAMAAAAQARDYNMTTLNDQYTNVYNTLYGQYTNEFNMLLSKLEATEGLENMDWNKFLSELRQYNIDKEFAFNEWATGFDMLQTNLGSVSALDQQAWERNYTTQQTQFENNLALAEFQSDEAYKAAQLNSRGSGGTGSGGDNTDVVDTMALYSAMAASGNPYLYLQQNYKSYGIGGVSMLDGILEDYERWVTNLGKEPTHTVASNEERKGFIFPQFMTEIEYLLSGGDVKGANDKINAKRKILTSDEIDHLNAMVLKWTEEQK